MLTSLIHSYPHCTSEQSLLHPQHHRPYCQTHREGGKDGKGGMGEEGGEGGTEGGMGKEGGRDGRGRGEG